MTCESCGNKPKNTAKDFTRAVIEIDNPETLVLLRKVVIPASMGTEEQVPAAIGKYKNVILYYEANKHVYIYSSDGIPTFLETEIPQEVWDRIQSLETNLAKETKDREDADKVLQDNIDAEAKARGDADTALDDRLTTVEGIAATALQPEAIDKIVMTDISLNANSSTTTVQIDGAKENLLTGAQSTKNLPLPVASHDEAGVMNSATFDAVTSNTSNISALMNGAVAITGLSASPSQSDLTTAWETETGLTSLMNRAGIYDVTNDKVWTYYTNTSTWYAASNTSQVTINTFTNSSEGTIKGSTNVGQVFAENDGTGSVNGWDTLSGNVSTNTNNISSLQTGKQDKLTAGANITISAQNVISATGANYTAGNAITIDPSDNNRIDAAVYPDDFFTAGSTTEGEGSNITLDKTIEAPIKSVEVKGDTFQQTYSGKNLWDFTGINPTSGTNFSSTFENGELSVSWTGGFNLYPTNGTGDSVTLDSSKTYTLSVKAKGFPLVFKVRGGSEIFRTTSTTDYTEFSGSFTGVSSFRIDIIRLQSSSGSASIKELQLEEGSTATTYEKFVGGTASPNPDYPQDINVVTGEQTVNVTGKNLLDSLHGYIDGYINASGGIGAGGGTNALFDYILVKPEIEYTLSQKSDSLRLRNYGFAYYDASKTFLSRATYSLQTAQTITTPSNCRFVRIWVANSQTGVSQEIIENAQLQFEQGSSASSYYPYQGQQSYPISLGSIELCKIGDYQDYIYKDGDDWYVHKAVGKVVLDGSETWTSGAYGVNSWILNGVIVTPYDTSKIQVMSELFRGVANDDRATSGNNIIFTSSARDVWIRDTTLTTLAEVQSATTGSYIYYALATPTDTKITDTDLISDLEDLAGGTGYLDTTHFNVTATGTNLPAILDIVAASKSLASILAMLNIFTNGEWDALWA